MCSLMEQRKYWMWSRRKFADKAHLGSFCHKIATTNSYNDIREEQDAASNLGDYVWPPRSYSCSFCRREFRSAQALGGHMNVHRRDRARLKQSPNLTSESLENNHHNQIACTPLGRQFPNQVGSLVCRPLSNPNCLAVASMHEHSDNPCAIPLTDPRTNHRVAMMDLNLGREKLKLREVGSNIPRCWSDGDVDVTSCKRQHTDPMFPFYMKSSSDQHQQQQSEVLKLGTKPVEELDLELRLGGHPNV